MNEQYKREEGSALENNEDQKFDALQTATEEVGRIMMEIDEFIKSTPDRAEAERIVLEKYAPQMDEAMKNSRQALDEWNNTIKESLRKEQE